MILETFLTFSGEQMLKVYGDSHPHGLIIIIWAVAENADIHCLCARLGCQSCQEDRVVCEIKYLPALSFICGNPENIQTHIVIYDSDHKLHICSFRKRTICNTTAGQVIVCYFIELICLSLCASTANISPPESRML